MTATPGSLRFLVVAAGVGLFGMAGAGEAGRVSDEPPVYRRWQAFAIEDGLSDLSIRSIRVADGAVWVGTDAGLAVYEEQRWKSWTAADGLPAAPISAIATDPRTGDVWLGTLGEGLVRFTAGRFDAFTQFNSGLAGDQVFGVTVAEGRVWAATNGGISAFQPTADRWELYFEPWAGRPETAVLGFCDGPDALYAGTWCGPLLRFDTATAVWSPITPTDSVRVGGGGAQELPTVSSIAAASGGRSLWWATQDRLFRRTTRGRWKARPIPDGGNGGTFVHSLNVRSEHEAWLGTDSGLLVLSDWKRKTWIAYRRAEAASHGSVTLIQDDRVVGSRVVESTIPDNRIRCLAFQGDDVWVGTRSGLARGTGLAPWRELDMAERSPGAPDAGGPCRTGNAQRASALEDTRAAGIREAIPIAVLGPLNRSISRPGADSAPPVHTADRFSVGRAVDRANSRHAGRGQPRFQLAEQLYTFARYRWGTTQDTFSILRHLHDVRGFVGAVGPDARIDTAMVLRTEVPVVNVAATEPTIDETLNPWIFRCGSNDPRRHRALLDFVLDVRGGSRLAVLHTHDPESEVHLERWLRHARMRGREPVVELELDPEDSDLSPWLDPLARSAADTVLTWSDAPTSARLLRAIRSAGLRLLFVGSDRIVGSEFIERVGYDPGDVIALARCPHFDGADDTVPPARDATRSVPGIHRPRDSPHAGRSLEAAAHLLAGIELAGPAPEAIRARLCEMNEIRIAVLENGVWQTLPVPDP